MRLLIISLFINLFLPIINYPKQLLRCKYLKDRYSENDCYDCGILAANAICIPENSNAV